MLRRLPGTFVAGEMLDWEAPTGGYLLQGSFSTGVAAARARWPGSTAESRPRAPRHPSRARARGRVACTPMSEQPGGDTRRREGRRTVGRSSARTGRTTTSNFGVGASRVARRVRVLRPLPAAGGQRRRHGARRRCPSPSRSSAATPGTWTPIADGSVALVVTSPPYFAGKQYEEELERDGVPSSYLEYLELLDRRVRRVRPHARAGRAHRGQRRQPRTQAVPQPRRPT